VRSEGKLFSFDVVDKEGGEIRVTAWNNAVDVFEPMLQVGWVQGSGGSRGEGGGCR
jgi:ssDNA-binding replication factor A large subunit